MTMRLYGAQDEMFNGTYEYPTVTFVQALRESTEPMDGIPWRRAWARIRRLFNLLSGPSVLDL